MPSWIAPSLAADYWNISEEEVWQRIHNGQLHLRQEGSFYFVDVAPDETSASFAPPAAADPSEEKTSTIVLPWVDVRRQSGAKRRRPAKAA
jgi:hypothetical protein